MTRASFQLPPTDRMPPLLGATAWLNTPELTLAALRGNVVLVNFWTYTCINWLRTLPYIRAWSNTYKDRGLVVLGIHTPEFAFEHIISNVQQAVDRLGVTYPVIVDNKYTIWNAFANHYWPALYFVDAEGRIRYNQFGEGEYEMAERVIQQLLHEAGAQNGDDDLVSVDLEGTAAPADWLNLQSPETYLGYSRATSFVSPDGVVLGASHTYQLGESLRLNQWTLGGQWTMDETAITSDAAGAKIRFCFHARDMHVVMGPVMRGTLLPFRIRLDGEQPGEAHGVDVDGAGSGTLADQRLYQLIRQPQPITDHLLEIEFLQPGAQALAFTFG